MDTLEIRQTNSGTLYRLSNSTERSQHFVFSHPSSRRITNDPLVYGLEYTHLLRDACEACVATLLAEGAVRRDAEDNGVVLHLLRGGLNFGLREALGASLGWNRHNSAFLSAQRARNANDPEEWHIEEDSYRKVYLPSQVDIFLADVVATGTSLKYGLEQLLTAAQSQGAEVRSITFFTIGGPVTEDIVSSFAASCEHAGVGSPRAYVVYLEGRFGVANSETPLSIKIDGTDLLRSPAVLAPEFFASQTENPLFPLERCTIYDAGSRAFWIPEYLEDVHDYWEQTYALAEGGMTYQDLLKERFPEIFAEGEKNGQVLSGVDLLNLAGEHTRRIREHLDRPSAR